ncbi:hypothetical protein TCAL_10582 [Tigriopus californicus]|uniref:Ionotropic glutamate receptor L-glutamate and glycine-binding domain-containing protein n=1 Tax=Tigriopus californicus TaxID=6832 RepID=A0A553PMJ3_TIGCA|nr:hypothetical protein TCAL_10582 [Tigriopus californicus]|eukprot:TCALIF_10582-PA protein Name:"Similar to grid2 Glutamate receptor ionotropic, delta-2 (Danio rerio)" AED:0.28 eAED:0.32 QI:0/0/0/0.33/1/1/3/0/579
MHRDWNGKGWLCLFLPSFTYVLADCGGYEIVNCMGHFFDWNKGVLILRRDPPHELLRRTSFPTNCRIDLDDIKATEWFSQSILICPDGFNEAALIGIMEQNIRIGTNHLVMVIDRNFSMFRKISLHINQEVYFFDPDTNVAKETYSVNGVRVEYPVFRRIPSTGQIQRITTITFLERRSNFHGQHFTAVTERLLPWVNFRETALQDHDIMMTPSGDIWYNLDQSQVWGYYKTIFLDILGPQMNFSTSLHVRKDRNWGSKTGTGEWTGMIASVAKHEADMGMTAMTINPSRFEVANFLIPLGTETYAIFIRRLGREEWSWQSYLKPFQDYLWFTLGLHVILTGLALHWFDLYHQPNESAHYQKISQFLGACWLVFGSYFGRKPNAVSAWRQDCQKYLLLGILLGGNVVFMAYRASLTSELSIRRTQVPFSTMEEFLASGFKLSLPSYYDLYLGIFLDAPAGSVFDQVYQTKVAGQEDAYFINEPDGLEKITANEDLAVFYNIESFADYKMYQCQIEAPWVTLYPGLLSVAFPKDSEYFPFIQYQTMRLLDQGTSSRALKAILREHHDLVPRFDPIEINGK